QTPPGSGVPQSKSGLDLGAIDKTANPCQDFYQYACGNWMKKNPIPADESRWGRFNELLERNELTLRGIAEDSGKHQDRSALDQKIGAYYGSCMDEGAIDKKGTGPIQPELERIAQLNNREDILDEVVRLHERQVDVFFTFGSEPDPKNASMDIADIDQGGLGLPDPDYYTQTDDRSKQIRQKYVAYAAKLFELIGVPQAEAEQKSETVLRIETALAKVSLTPVQRRDPQLLVHEYQEAQLATLTPAFNFIRYFTAQDTPKFSKLNVAVPDFFKGLNVLLASDSMNDLRDYLTFHYVDASSRRLTSPFVDANFDFYGRTLTGADQLRPRWKRCVDSTDREIGEALGQKFVDATFGQQGKERTLELVGQIEHEMAHDIETISWMSPETKKQALIKLHGVTNKIGYPDKWRDYSSLSLVDGDYLGNFYRAQEFESKRDRNKIGKPVDKSEWGMTPPTVNAYYDPQENNINFPAGILQPPFYSNSADDAVNFGGVGVVIGHELTHGFDDEGRQFDADGNLRDWWQKQDADRFDKLADCFVNEYGSFSPLKGVELNGKLTLGENTADNGGLHLAYYALMNQLAKDRVTPSHEVDGYTETQQFFLGFAQLWCENAREPLERLMAKTNPHSPGKFRVLGTVENFPAFSEAFGCKEGDAMYADPSRACRVW
ncbi:MAG TPA: M13 family metallopeptidase, partial [Bryobacteraceae bacterium]|nr:M13 family metallopeptidase [Bryobacteraceae bacterium]